MEIKKECIEEGWDGRDSNKLTGLQRRGMHQGLAQGCGQRKSANPVWTSHIPEGIEWKSTYSCLPNKAV